MNKERMFVVPSGFVPFNDTVTLLNYKRLRNLDLDIDVYALKGKEDPGILKELEKDQEFKKFNITYNNDLNWVIPRNNPLRLPVSLFLMLKYVLDAEKEFRKKNYKYLYTSIAPGIGHICGYFIKKKHPEVKWIASFSDPFKGSPYKKEDLSDRSIFYRIAFNVGSFFLYNNLYEEVAVKNADRLVFICEEQRDFTLKQYEDYKKYLDKAVIYPLTYIPEWEMYADLLNEKHTSKNNKQIAVHLGRLYGLRKIDSFIEALKELKDEYPDLNEKIEFHQYSEIQKADIEKIKEYGLDNLFFVHDKVSYNRSVEIMKEADVLLLFDTLMPDKEIQPYLPSKIVEYLMLKKPILGICDKNSPSYRILKEYGFDTVGSDVKKIKDNIMSVVNNEFNGDYSLSKLNNSNYGTLLTDEK